MQRIVETENKQENVLIVQKNETKFLNALIKEIQKLDIFVEKTSELPYSFGNIDYLFVFKESYPEGEIRQLFASSVKTLIITSNEKIFHEFDDMIKRNHKSHVRVVLVSENEVREDVVEKILWFMLTKSHEVSLNMRPTLEPVKKKKKKPLIKITLTRKRIGLAVLVGLVALHTLFTIPLAFTTYHTYKAGIALQDQNITNARESVDKARNYYILTESTYVLAKPGLQFTFLSVVPENTLNILDDSITFIDTAITASQNTRVISALLLDTSKTPAQIQEMRELIAELEEDVVILERTSQSIYDRLDYDFEVIQDTRAKFEQVSQYVQTGSTLISHLDSILSDNTEKDYIFFFYNNMELRPGGGFIGSFAHVVFSNYTLKSFDVYDVYDADGQLETHVRPPQPIREYLEQPHWFLRDSNFSPDFEENVKTAEYFLDKELNLTDFDGAVAITTTALTYMLDAFGDVYIPDFKETINADNFYLKAQSQHELDFFPGSTAKKSFLSTVGRTLLLKLQEADPALLGIAVKKALDEKHIVILTDDPTVQKDIDVLGWSGKLLNPQCIVNTSSCIINHILPVEANLGVNKANYFVSKLMKLKTVFQEDGEVQNELSISFTNSSAEGVFPGGPYKNYYQLYIPFNADIDYVEVNGNKIRDYDEANTGLFKVVGVYLEIEPKETSIVTVGYTLQDKAKSGENAYQIVLQKQLGSFNSDFSLEVVFPDSFLITDQNFKSVAKNNSVLYNSSLSTNKVFVIEFVKE